jgi:hypothetical protein
MHGGGEERGWRAMRNEKRGDDEIAAATCRRKAFFVPARTHILIVQRNRLIP